MHAAYFVVGTDTDVGKTYVSCALLRHFVAQGYQSVGMKPLASGCQMDGKLALVNADAQALLASGNVHADMDVLNPYRFLPAIDPHIAAQQAEVAIDLDLILRAYRSLANEAEVVVVEGAGGFLTPISAQQSLADLAQQLAIPIILVVGMRLGCINHALLTVEAIQARGLRLAGWVANSLAPNMPYYAENLSTLQQAIDAPCLSVVPWQGEAQFKLSL